MEAPEDAWLDQVEVTAACLTSAIMKLIEFKLLSPSVYSVLFWERPWWPAAQVFNSQLHNGHEICPQNTIPLHFSPIPNTHGHLDLYELTKPHLPPTHSSPHPAPVPPPLPRTGGRWGQPVPTAPHSAAPHETRLHPLTHSLTTTPSFYLTSYDDNDPPTHLPPTTFDPIPPQRTEKKERRSHAAHRPPARRPSGAEARIGGAILVGAQQDRRQDDSWARKDGAGRGQGRGEETSGQDFFSLHLFLLLMRLTRLVGVS